MTVPLTPDELFADSTSPGKDEKQTQDSLIIQPDDLFSEPLVPPVQATARELVKKIQPDPLAPPEPFARDVAGTARLMKPLPLIDEGRRAQLERQQEAYRVSPQKIIDDLKNTASIKEDDSGFAKFRQKLASTRLLTDKSLIEFDVGNTTGFHIGTPLAHPYETAKELIVGMPHFFLNLVKQPAELALNEMLRGTKSEMLLPEEREQYFKEVIANYAGLVLGRATGIVSTELRVGSGILREGVAAAEKAGIAASPAELAAIRATLPRALAVEEGTIQKMITGLHEGAAGGFIMGGILERDARDEGRLNEMASYVISALPIGIAFEGVKSLKKAVRPGEPKLGPMADAAVQASDLFMLRQMQASESRTMQQNVETFYHMTTSDELAQATIRAHRALGGSTVIPGVKNPDLLDVGDATIFTHKRPDGLWDVAIGIPEGLVMTRKGLGEGPVGEAPPAPKVEERYVSVDDALGAKLTEDLYDPSFADPITGKNALVAKAGTVLTPDIAARIADTGVDTYKTDKGHVSGYRVGNLIDPKATVDNLVGKGTFEELQAVNPQRVNKIKSELRMLAANRRAREGNRGLWADKSPAYKEKSRIRNDAKEIALKKELAELLPGLTEEQRTIVADKDEAMTMMGVHLDRLMKKLPPSAGKTVDVMKEIHRLGFQDILITETAERGQGKSKHSTINAIDVEHAARTILHDYETLVAEGLDPKTAARTMLLQHEIKSAGVLPSEARAMFEVGGFFPNQHVSFLGRDYVYSRPVIGKKGQLEGHIIKYGDGSEVEVPWDQLRRGPDMMINNYEASSYKTQRALFKDFERVVKDGDPSLPFPEAPFKEMVMKYVSTRLLPHTEIAPLMHFLGEQLADRLRIEHLPPEEHAAFKRMVSEGKRYPFELAHSLTDVATSNGMHVERSTGGLLVLDTQTNEVLGSFKSPEAAKRFINTSGQGSGPDLTPSGPVPPDAINRGLMAVPPPPNGPHTSAFTPVADGSLGRFNHWFNTTWIGTHLTGMQQIMKSMDSQSLLKDPAARTEFFARVADPLQRAFKLKLAAMAPDHARLAATSRMARGLTTDQLDQVITARETMDPVDMVKPGGLFPRAFTDREVAAADWFVKNNIDIAKAFSYRRGLIKLEQRYASKNPDDINTAVKRLQISTNVDEAHVEAARIIGEVLRKNEPGELSIYGITRLADGIMKKHTNPETYMNESGFTPQMRALHTEISSHFKDLGDKFDIPDEKKLGGYFTHFKMYKDDQIFTQPDGTPVFTSDLLRTGELSEFDRDPVSVLNRYMNMGYNERYTKVALDEAYKYVNETTAQMPAGGEFFKNLITDHYVNQLRGVPLESSKLAQRLFSGVFPRLGMKLNEIVMKDLVNTFVSLQSSAMIGFRPVQAARDLHNLTAIHYTRFGAERTAAMYTMMHRVTPEELVAAGFLKETKPGEGISQAFEREGLTSSYGPISVLSPQERLANTISAKSQPFFEAVQKLGEMGVDWSLQRNVYQWAHSAVMLESTTKTLKELNKLNALEYGKGEAAKAKAYDNLFINSYDLPVVREFDRLVSAGQIREAADFLGRATAFETVGTFGLANHPAGWGTSTGKMFGQFGNWSVWARSMLARQATRGTAAERTRVAVRFGLTQGSLALASAALGLNLNSWYLPGGAPTVNALGHLVSATEEFDEERTAELQKAAAVIALGVPGSLLFRGGPALGLATAAMAGGTGTEQGESEAVRAGGNLAKQLVPGSYLLQDILLGVAMAQNGDNPVSAWLQALGIRSTEEPSMLNDAGAFKPLVSDIEF